MSDTDAPRNRRRFIASIAGGTAALAAAGFTASDLLAQGGGGVPNSPPPQGGWDMSWLNRVEKAKHRHVFDAPDVADGMALNHTNLVLRGYAEVYQTTDADAAAVVVYRHLGLPAVLNDDMWSRLKLGERTKVKDRATNEFALRNPFLRLKPADPAAPSVPSAPEGGADAPSPLQTGLDTLIARGVIVLCCNLALMQHAGRLARAESMPVEDARASVINALVPGVIRMPSGVFAVARAQEAGCHFIRST
ncbi:MAG: hypothetical protein ACHQQ3_03010 [Gemmatimonadales bacterium]